MHNEPEKQPQTENQEKTQTKRIGKGRIILFTVIGLYTVLLLIHGLYPTISCTVVDAETGKPIEGAVILAEWTTARGFGYTTQDSYKITQVVTDKDGKAKISGYIFNVLVLAPAVTVYKKGYVAWNNERIFPGNNKRTDFSWRNGYVFSLETFKEGYSYDDHRGFVYIAINASLGKNKDLFLKLYQEAEFPKIREELNRKEREGR